MWAELAFALMCHFISPPICCQCCCVVTVRCQCICLGAPVSGRLVFSSLWIARWLLAGKCRNARDCSEHEKREGRGEEIAINFNCSCTQTLLSLSLWYTVHIDLPAQMGHVRHVLEKIAARQGCSKRRVLGRLCTLHDIPEQRNTKEVSSWCEKVWGMRRSFTWAQNSGQWLPAPPNQKNHTEEKLFAHNSLTVILTTVPIQTDSFAREGHEKECHYTDGFVLTIEYKMPSDSK